MSEFSLLAAIRKQCVEYMGNQHSLVEGCTSPKCSLFPYRMGVLPLKSKKWANDRFSRIPSDGEK